MPTAGMTLRWDIPKTLAAKALFSSHLSSLVCRPTKPVVGPRMKGGWRLQVGEGTRDLATIVCGSGIAAM